VLPWGKCLLSSILFHCCFYFAPPHSLINELHAGLVMILSLHLLPSYINARTAPCPGPHFLDFLSPSLSQLFTAWVTSWSWKQLKLFYFSITTLWSHPARWLQLSTLSRLLNQLPVLWSCFKLIWPLTLSIALLINLFSFNFCWQMVFSEDLGPCVPNGRIQAEHVDGVNWNGFSEGRGVTHSARWGKRKRRARVSW
jgi:hypothetical protein